MTMMAEYKTKSGCYNEDDFVQCNEGMNELTVTITLCEYRNLVRGQVEDEKTIIRLQDEVARLKVKNEMLSRTAKDTDDNTDDAEGDEDKGQPTDAELRGEEYYANQGDEE